MRVPLRLGLLALISSTACTTHLVPLHYAESEARPAAAESATPLVSVGAFLDQRKRTGNWLGAIRGGYGNRLKTLRTDRPMSAVVEQVFRDGLEVRGLLAQPADALYELRGAIQKLDCSYYMRKEAHAHLTLELVERASDRTVFERSYKADNVEGGWGAGIFARIEPLRALAERTLRQAADMALDDPALDLALAPPGQEPPSVASSPPPLRDGARRDPTSTLAPGKASIYIVRSGFAGREYMMPVVDDRVLGGLLPRTYLHVEVAPGKHRLYGSYAGVDRSPGLEVELSDGDQFFARMLRVYASAQPKAEIHPLSVEIGQQAVRRYRAGVAFPSALRPPTRVDLPRAREFAPPTDKALVYVIRRGMSSPARMGARSRSKPPQKPKLAVIMDGHIVALMPARTYTAFEVDPGRHSLVGAVFTTHTLDPVEFEVEGGRSYFFDASTARRGKERHAPIEWMDEQDGRATLQLGKVVWLE